MDNKELNRFREILKTYKPPKSNIKIQAFDVNEQYLADMLAKLLNYQMDMHASTDPEL